MRALQLLEDGDETRPTDWVRPLVMVGSHDDFTVNGFSMYSGAPINNVKWVQFQDIFGKVHFGKTVQQMNELSARYHHDELRRERFEFMRGDMPADHIWNWRLDKSQHAQTY